MSKQSEMEYSLYRVKFPRQTLVKEPKLVGKTAGVVFEYTNDHGSQQEYIVAPIDPIGYITELLKWFNAEERAIEAMPLNDLGTKNVYKANLRHFIRIVPDHEILEETKMQIPDVNTLKKKPTKTIKFGKWSVHEETFNDYVNAVREMRSAYEPAFDDGENTPMPKDPLEQLATFQQRVKLHKKLFKEAGVPYHGNTNATKASHDLSTLIEKRMEKEL